MFLIYKYFNITFYKDLLIINEKFIILNFLKYIII